MNKTEIIGIYLRLSLNHLSREKAKFLRANQHRAEINIFHSVVSINVADTVSVWEDWLILLS